MPEWLSLVPELPLCTSCPIAYRHAEWPARGSVHDATQHSEWRLDLAHPLGMAYALQLLTQAGQRLEPMVVDRCLRGITTGPDRVKIAQQLRQIFGDAVH